MGGAKGIIHKDVAQRSQFARQVFLVLLLTHVQTAVFQQHQLAGRDAHTIHPVGHQGDLAPQQLAQTLCDGSQRVFRFELTFRRTTQVAGHHDRSAGLECHLDGGHRGADACVFGDAPCIVLRNIEVGADEDALAGHLAAGAQIGEAKDVHRCEERELTDRPWKRWSPIPTAAGPHCRQAHQQPECRTYQPSPTCSGRYTSMPTTMVPRMPRR